MSDDTTIAHEGMYGSAVRLNVADAPNAAETVCCWLITAPQAHPYWSQYSLCVVRLRDNIPGFPPPIRQFLGATHEFLVLAMNPDGGPYSQEQLERTNWHLNYLVPVNVCEQFEATDDEMTALASLSAGAVVTGLLCPEAADAPERIRGQWLTSLVRTLVHIRGEEHAE